MNEARLCGNCWHYHCANFIPAIQDTITFPPPPKIALSTYPNTTRSGSLLQSDPFMLAKNQQISDFVSRYNFDTQFKAKQYSVRPTSNSIDTWLSDLPRLTLQTHSRNTSRDKVHMYPHTDYLKTLGTFPSKTGLFPTSTVNANSIVTHVGPTTPLFAITPVTQYHPSTIYESGGKPFMSRSSSVHQSNNPSTPKAIPYPVLTTPIADQFHRAPFTPYESETVVIKQMVPKYTYRLNQDDTASQLHTGRGDQTIQKVSSQKQIVIHPIGRDRQKQIEQNQPHPNIQEDQGQSKAPRVDSSPEKRGRLKIHSCTYRDNRCMGVNMRCIRSQEINFTIDQTGHKKDYLLK